MTIVNEIKLLIIHIMMIALCENYGSWINKSHL